MDGRFTAYPSVSACFTLILWGFSPSVATICAIFELRTPAVAVTARPVVVSGGLRVVSRKPQDCRARLLLACRALGQGGRTVAYGEAGFAGGFQRTSTHDM